MSEVDVRRKEGSIDTIREYYERQESQLRQAWRKAWNTLPKLLMNNGSTISRYHPYATAMKNRNLITTRERDEIEVDPEGDLRGRLNIEERLDDEELDGELRRRTGKVIDDTPCPKCGNDTLYNENEGEVFCPMCQRDNS